MKRNSTLWITDPWETLDHPNDTSLRLAEEGVNLGLPQYWADVKSIRLEDAQVLIDAKELQAVGKDRSKKAFTWGPLQSLDPGVFKTLHYRTDPPVDAAYLHPLQLLALSLAKSPRAQLVNPLKVLLESNEKMEAAALRKAKLLPPSVVSSQWETLKKFGLAQGRTVLKPLHEAQSHGIELLDWRSEEKIRNSKMLLSNATHGFSTPILLQKYLEGIAEGETRLWFLDGKLLACVKKMPVNGDFRVNMDGGSQLLKTRLSPREKTAAQKIALHLRSKKIRLAAVDLIEGWITDFNFTSPGLIPQMERILGTNLARTIVKTLSRA